VLKIISGMGPQAFGYPPLSGPLDSSGSFGVLEGLVGVDGAGEPTPKLATKWEVSPDGKNTTFTLRKGAKFHDGTDFNAQAVKWMVDLYIESGMIPTVTSIDAVDDYTVRFNMPQYNNAVFTQISDIMYVSPTAVEKNGIDWAKTHAVGTGPFMQKEFIRDVSITKVRFDDYWDEGLPYLDGVTNIYIPDATTAMMSFEAGEAQILMVGNNGKTARDLARLGYEVRGIPGMAQFLVTDSAHEDSPFSKFEVRLALEYAINKKAVVDTVGQGYMVVLNQLAPPGWVGNNPDLADRPYDPEKARQLLAQAGHPDGFSTTLMGIAAFTNPDVATALQAYCADIGIDVTVDLMDMGRGFQTRMAGWNNGIMIGGTGLDPNMTQRLSVDLGAGTPNYPDTIKPALWQPTLDKALAARTLEDRGKALEELMKVNYDEEFVICCWATYDIAALDPSFHGDILTYHHIKWNPADAWLSK
jgi:peptide/nickel transport system substrate-binding protein